MGAVKSKYTKMGAQQSRAFVANSNGTELEKFCSLQCANRSVTAFVAYIPCDVESLLQKCESKGIYRNCICEELNIKRWAIALSVMGAFLVVVKFLHYFAVKLRRKREIE